MAPTNAAIRNDRPIRVACLGGGQLGRMMAMEAPRLNIQMYFLDGTGSACPAASVVPSNQIIKGSIQNADDILQFVQTVQPDVVTTEIEHVNCAALQELEKKNVVVRPCSSVIQLIQDKYLQKVHFQSVSNPKIPLPPFVPCSTIEDIRLAVDTLGLPLMLKARTGAYDGRGNAILKCNDESSIHNALQKLGAQETKFMLYAEGWVDFDYEIAVMVVRSDSASQSSSPSDGTISRSVCYPSVNAIQQDSICRVVFAPARFIANDVQIKAQELALAAIESLPDGIDAGSGNGSCCCGIFGVEMFVTKSGAVLLNEVAPRPHNTGHYTQDAASASQFENHLRAICSLPLGSAEMKVPASAMINVLGKSNMKDTMRSSNAALQMKNAIVHWYGKSECRLGRKMGHINLVGTSTSELDTNIRTLLELEGIDTTILNGRTEVVQASETTTTIVNSSQEPTPLVGVIMGSHSDLPTMAGAIDILEEFGVSYEVDIVSAHRTPEKLMTYAQSASDRGLRVIIAGAGGAAHLPGMVAAMTPLPVIGVPVKTSTLSGVDSLYSIVQMPKGVPVATVAIGNATNAGLLAVRILGTSHLDQREQMTAYQKKMKDSVHAVSSKLCELGYDEFLNQMDNKNTSVNV
jgi:phosphoribosylaminoimidazole carboxylase